MRKAEGEVSLGFFSWFLGSDLDPNPDSTGKVYVSSQSKRVEEPNSPTLGN
jgi:hypothetical protein